MACNLSTKLSRAFLVRAREGQIQEKAQSGFGAWEYHAKRLKESHGEISDQGCREIWAQ
jgi:hypothetical protein